MSLVRGKFIRLVRGISWWSVIRKHHVYECVHYVTCIRRVQGNRRTWGRQSERGWPRWLRSLKRGSVALQPLACWDRGFEHRWEYGCSSIMFVVCCVGSSLCDELITRLEESYREWACVSNCRYLNGEVAKAINVKLNRILSCIFWNVRRR